MRCVIARLKSNAWVPKSMESQLLGLGVLLGAVTLVAGLAFAYPSDHKDWMACAKDDDCTSVELGCYYWQPVNRKHAAEMKTQGPPACSASVPSGPQPLVHCLHQVCENDYRGRDWHYHGDELVDQRIDSCLEAAGLTINWRAERAQYDGLHSTYMQRITKVIRENPSAADKRLEYIIASEMPCEAVTAKAKSFTKQSQ